MRTTTAAMPSDPAANAAFVALEHELTLLVRRSQAIHARLARELHDGLHGAAYGLLVLLDDEGPLRVGDLVARRSRDRSTVGRQVATLVDAGLAQRIPHLTDKRTAVLAVTAAGQRRLRQVRAVRRAWWLADLSTWPTADVEELVALVGRVNQRPTVNESAMDP